MKKKQENMKEPTIAPGMDDQEELDMDASKEEKEKGEFTNVYSLSLDEVDPS
ncbi:MULTISPECIES: hypothetical protein [unclassified Bacillus (in: firmicutes)]|uniref:hypothetical protein n=1 Tax=unclassified Bacillus (in: firmicutes) TaxID=185979 RepID=UPI001BE5F1A9|nr:MULTISPECIES: hypothetical protein [unclassified Bacillus (in: firmicutes)]MBT2638025.1 hypothetical protein [Bacillus sp. ISL-39]MBT2661200.1 hypothetical protein [Bacillus sp. ISL-45]